MKTIVVDCSGVGDRAAFWERYVKEVKPQGAGHFGRNLDAFWDALHGGPGMPEQDEVRFVNSAQLEGIDDGQFLEALRKIARESRGETRIVFE
jgi:ribonuclease inhibitor